MNWQDLQILLFVGGSLAFTIAGMQAAYHNGVNDGYMFAKDPTCPGYRKARRILESYGKITEQAGPGSAAAARPASPAPR